MRVFAVSDIHIDYSANQEWISQLSRSDYREDVLILAGDVSDKFAKLEWCLQNLVARFKQVLFVPGNHDLWVFRDGLPHNSFEKFALIAQLVRDSGASMQAWQHGSVNIVPLQSWYDYSFGEPGEILLEAWMDFRACRWPQQETAQQICAHFLQTNLPLPAIAPSQHVITFSHFLPRIDVMPSFIPQDKRYLYPVLGSSLIDLQLRQLGSKMHVYGHSHVNRQVSLDGVVYINNAFAYPNETRIAAKQLLQIFEV